MNNHTRHKLGVVLAKGNPRRKEGRKEEKEKEERKEIWGADLKERKRKRSDNEEKNRGSIFRGGSETPPPFFS